MARTRKKRHPALTIAQEALRALGLLALIVVASIHSPIEISAQGPADLTAVMLPDGTVPIFCFTPGSEGPTKPHAHSQCDNGRLVGSVTLPPAPALPAGPIGAHAPAVALLESRDLAFDTLWAPAAPRAPPPLDA